MWLYVIVNSYSVKFLKIRLEMEWVGLLTVAVP